MSYISEDETDKHIFTIIELFKKSKHDEVIDIIKHNNIDPQHSYNIISDYAALWLEEPHLIPFLKKIKKIGGNPLGHRTIIKNVATQGKIDTLKYLIDEGAFHANEIKDELVFILNGIVMDGHLESLKLFAEHIDIMQYKMTDESNPSIINRAFNSPHKNILDYLFDNNLVQPYLFSNEVINAVETLKMDINEPKMIINKILDYFDLDKSKYDLSTEKYEPGDITTIFKMMQVDILDKELKVNKKHQKTRKI
jgi:hypothetical protein